MIFASDLDRTLIYSSKFINDKQEVEAVEYKDDKPLSYMTKKARKMLCEVRDKLDFIPVTTRTMEQYKRITLFHGESLPKYAITSNGGNVLVDGKPDFEWQAYIQESISKDGYDLEYVYKMADELINQSWVEKARIADSVFFYLLVYKDDVDLEMIREWSGKLDAIGWELIEHGRKIYCIPKCVNKRDALKYVASKIDNNMIVSSGDSRMDLIMKSVSHKFIVPLHGELVLMKHVENSDDVVITENEGIKAAESVLVTVLGMKD